MLRRYSSYYTQQIAIDMYKDTLHQERHVCKNLLILVALDIHNFDIFEDNEGYL